MEPYGLKIEDNDGWVRWLLYDTKTENIVALPIERFEGMKAIKSSQRIPTLMELRNELELYNNGRYEYRTYVDCVKKVLDAMLQDYEW